MGLPTLNKFLCCFSLEAGGIFLGWLTAIISAIGIFGAVSILIMVLVDSDSFDDSYDDNSTLLIVLYVVLVVYILYLLLLFYAGVQLVRGTKNKNHVQMKLYLVLMAIGCILSFLQIFTAQSGTLASSIIGAIISAYLFICVYSLYQKTKEARSDAGTIYNEHPNNLYPTQAGIIYSTQPTHNGGIIYNQNHGQHPGIVYTQNTPPSYPGFVNTLNPVNSGVVTTGKA